MANRCWVRVKALDKWFLVPGPAGARRRNEVWWDSFAGLKEGDAFVSCGGMHAGECLVEDDDIWFMDEGADKEDDALLGGTELSEGHCVSIVDVVVCWEVGLLLHAVRKADVWEGFAGFAFNGRWDFFGGCGVRVKFSFEEAEGGADIEVAVVIKFGSGEESVCEGGLDGLADCQLAGEEGVDFGGGVTHAGLELEE